MVLTIKCFGVLAKALYIFTKYMHCTHILSYLHCLLPLYDCLATSSCRPYYLILLLSLSLCFSTLPLFLSHCLSNVLAFQIVSWNNTWTTASNIYIMDMVCCSMEKEKRQLLRWGKRLEYRPCDVVIWSIGDVLQWIMYSVIILLKEGLDFWHTCTSTYMEAFQE